MFRFFRYFVFTAKKPTGTAPEITIPLEDVTVVEGEPATLECELKGEPQPDIEWFRDGEQVKESKRVRLNFDGILCSLTFKPSELDDEGEYKCIARNELGSASTAAELLVNEAGTKPEFIEKLKNISALPGKEARFDVRITGSPPPEVDWFKGKEKIEDEGRFVLIDDEAEDLFSLVIEDAKPSDSGEYECVAFNEIGEVSCKGNLVVEETLAVPELAEQEESALPISEETIIAPKVAEDAESALPLTEEAIIAPKLAEEAESAIPVTEETPVAPEFAEEGESAPIVIEEGEDVSLSANVKGKPTPEVEWSKDDKNVKASDHLDIGEKNGKHTLLIKGATPKDSGIYKCKASSKGGVAERTFDVQVKGKGFLLSPLLRFLLVFHCFLGSSVLCTFNRDFFSKSISVV